MKTMKLSVALAAALFSATSFTGKVSAFVNVIPMDIPEKSIVQVTAPENTAASVYIYDEDGTMLHADRINQKSSTTRIYDFTNLESGVYTFESRMDLMNVTKKIGVNDSKVEILSKEFEFKPVFMVKRDQLMVNFMNQEMAEIEFTLESSDEIYYTGNEGNDFNFQKTIDISKLWNGEYYATLKVGGQTYYHYFNVN